MTQIVSRNPNFNGKDDRADAWIISCDAWDNEQRPGLVLPINPEGLEVRMPIRGSESSMYGGKFIVRRADPRSGSVFEYPVVSIKFNSGNILPMHADTVITEVQRNSAQSADAFMAARQRLSPIPTDAMPASAGKSDNMYGRYKHAHTRITGRNRTPGMYAGLPHMPVGVQNLYALFSLVNETWIIDSGKSDVGLGNKRYTKLNRVRLSCSNLVMPGLVLYGFLDESGLQWSETADQYNNFDLSFNLVVTHSLPRLRGVQFSNLIESYKSLFTQRSQFDAEYDISCNPYPAPEAVVQPIPPTPATAQQPPKTWAQRIHDYGQSTFGNGREGGAVRAALGNGVGLSTSAADRYASKALEKVDPNYAAQVRARRDAAQRETDIANGTGTVQTVDDFALFGDAAA